MCMIGYVLLALSLIASGNSQQQNGNEDLIQAVGAGYSVTFSSTYTEGHERSYSLDSCHAYACAWCANAAKAGQWFQISSNEPKIWKTIITQGRANLGISNGVAFWITSYHIIYTLDGMTWMNYNYGKTFQANRDRNTKVFNELNPPIRARAVRIIVDSWQGDLVCMRAGALIHNG